MASSVFNSALYRKSPRWLQEIYIAMQAVVRNALRESSRFETELAEVLRTQWLSEAEMRDYQLKRMRTVVHHAATHVPYYSELFRAKNLHPQDFTDLVDFASLPLMTKLDVLSAGESLLASDYRGIRYKGATGGTTGLSLIGFRSLAAIIRENAFLWRQLQWAGFQKGQRRAWIRGDMIVPAEQQRPPFWRFNRADNMLMMSSFHLSEPNAEAYIQALEQFDPIMIQAYPSSIGFLAQYLETQRRSYRGEKLRSIVTASETLNEHQKMTIERAMRCKVFDRYGCFEQVASIGTCEDGTYHIISDYALVELLPQSDGSAEVVGTGFDNSLMPLLRYRTEDSVIPMDANYRCPCGRSFPAVKKILGRTDDSIKTPDGRQIAMMSIMFDGLDNLLQGQVVQDAVDSIRIRVVPVGPLDNRAKEDLSIRARKLVGPDMNIEVEVVNDIPRTRNGKFRGVICNI